MRVGMLALMRPVITSTDGRCVARMRWMPEARAFCASRAISSSTFLPTIIIRSASSSMMTTMYGSRREVGDGALVEARIGGGVLHHHRILDGLAGLDGVLHLAVEAGEVAHTQRRHQLVATLHLGHTPAQRIGRMLHVGDHRCQQVRDALVHDSSSIFGSIMIMRTCSAVLL